LGRRSARAAIAKRGEVTFNLLEKNRMKSILTIVLFSIGLFAFAGTARAEKHKHVDGDAAVAGKLKTNGTHQVHADGSYTHHAEIKDGKIVGWKIKHASKGEMKVKIYKSAKKLASVDGSDNGAQPTGILDGVIGFVADVAGQAADAAVAVVWTSAQNVAVSLLNQALDYVAPQP
jgi:hypothetical protein